jgi:large subunit ribosomal protein L17
MKHQIGKKKLNLKPPHKRSLLRNQVILLIENGHLVTTKARAKEVKKLAEQLITLARKGNTFEIRRRAKMLLPYKDAALTKLFTEIAPNYTERPGGYTRIIPLGKRVSDTATIARLEWVA